MKRYMIYAGVAFTLLAGALVLSINQSLAGLAQQFFPGTFGWIFSALLALEAFALLRLWRGFFGGKSHLVFPEDRNPEEQERFVKEFSRRLRTSPHLDHTVLDPADDMYTEQCLAILKEKADAEIRRTAERIFVATSLSQNGRLDALIVFASLCRLVWRISGIYNQKPHPSEITSLYWSVVSATFIALSFEDLDISTEITVGFGEAFNSMAPAAMTGSVPFVGAAMQTFTASVIGGAANAFLALRTGIITRNAYTYAAQEKHSPSRVSVYKEAGGILLAMSGKLTDQFSRALSHKLWGVTKSAHEKTLRAGQHIVNGISSGVSTMGSSVATGISRAGGGISSGVSAMGSSVATGISRAGGGIVAGAVRAKDGIMAETVAVTGKMVEGIGVVRGGVNEGVTKVTSETVAAAKAVTAALRHAGRQATGVIYGERSVFTVKRENTPPRADNFSSKKTPSEKVFSSTGQSGLRKHKNSTPDITGAGDEGAAHREQNRDRKQKNTSESRKSSFFTRLFGIKTPDSKKEVSGKRGAGKPAAQKTGKEIAMATAEQHTDKYGKKIFLFRKKRDSSKTARKPNPKK